MDMIFGITLSNSKIPDYNIISGEMSLRGISNLTHPSNSFMVQQVKDLALSLQQLRLDSGAASVPGLGNSTCCKRGQKQNKTKQNKTKHIQSELLKSSSKIYVPSSVSSILTESLQLLRTRH